MIQIIGAGLAGISAAIHLARRGVPCNLFSLQPSERAQSVLAEGSFFGTSAAMTSARLLSALPESQKSEFYRAYRSHFYEGCGKSLACRNISPAGIDIDRLLVNSNAAAIWKRKKAFRVHKEEKP